MNPQTPMNSQNDNKGNFNKQKAPPIILRNTTKWSNCFTYLKEQKINFERARQADGGIKIYRIEPKDYHKISSLLL